MSLGELDHIAFRVKDIEPVVKMYTETMGFEVVQELVFDLEGSKVRSKLLNLPGTKFLIFVDMGTQEGDILSEWVKEHGNAIHHMAYRVEDIHKSFEELKAKGMKFTTDKVIDTGGGLKQLFSHPHPETGLITELIKREKDDIFFVQENVEELIKSTNKFNK
ncbi:MAG: VOC family protein [Rhodothermaceae bacterium]